MPTPHTLPTFRTRLLPVVVLTHPNQAVPLAHALLEGGIDVMEITLRHPAAWAGIEQVAQQVPQMKVGAGTLTRASEVQRVCDAGAQFALSPGCTPALVQATQNAGLPFIPGVATPSEVMAARDAGFTLLKCFPAAQLGGIETLKAWAGPLGDVSFCPTGGIDLSNLSAYLALPNVALVGGSWLTPAEALQSGDWAHITALTKAAMQVALNAPA